MERQQAEKVQAGPRQAGRCRCAAGNPGGRQRVREAPRVQVKEISIEAYTRGAR